MLDGDRGSGVAEGSEPDGTGSERGVGDELVSDDGGGGGGGG